MKISIVERNLLIFVLLFIMILSVFPFLFMFIIAMKSPGESVTGLSSLYVLSPTFDNFIRVNQIIPLYRNMLNSVVVSSFGALTTVFFCALAGFAFAKYEFPGKEVMFFVMIATMMVPEETSVIPVFIIIRNLGWVNNLLSLIVPKIATAIGIFYMRQYITAFPSSVMEQSRIDGCGEFRIFWNIVLPNITPALAAWGSISFIVRWNELLWPLLFMRSRVMYTLTVAISLLPTAEGLSTPWQVIMAGAAVSVIPLIGIYFMLQRFQIAGLMTGSLKG
ncbi:carbohydrate ABC transporter membrane protein 2, CUT1 family [Alkalispirochaeta americana]|uniref:sn-glycerol-3-phosphate transport system permease protein UgpE n=1 Tax=Alkalispirochaeta americana TaxID=159291 RepID=A0A1N6XWV6_9SPIO|nr:carbohydrate ABC transporter permease [Alkalispirochaeta americana]SIR06862.1 carbohydrate ABC transporter membrane protein 2, CUT1 family [Alkalispirochaeta americana]